MDIPQKIFNISSEKEFNELALEIFRFQYENVTIYRHYIQLINKNISEINEVTQIPFIPISFFKTHNIHSKNSSFEKVFKSSGTTGEIQSNHFIQRLSIYEKSLTTCFELFYGNVKDYVIFALMPSASENETSSLAYMASKLILSTKNNDSGFYLGKEKELINKIELYKNTDKRLLLLGLTYALLDFAENYEPDLNNVIVMETGGMKGKRQELTKAELHKNLCAHFNISTIHSEYGMTELLSQAYSLGKGIFFCPPWMKAFIRDANDPFCLLNNNKTGGINIIDLANINSCSFIATDDQGKINDDNSFEILGRLDNSDIRGCNLMLE